MIERPKSQKEQMLNNVHARVFEGISVAVLQKGWIKDTQELKPGYVSLPHLGTDRGAVSVFQVVGLRNGFPVVSIGEGGYKIRSVYVLGENHKRVFAKGEEHVLKLGISGFPDSELTKSHPPALALKYEEDSRPLSFQASWRRRRQRVCVGDFSDKQESVLLLNPSQEGIRFSSVVLPKNWREAFNEKRTL